MYLEIWWVVTIASFRDTILMLAVYGISRLLGGTRCPAPDKGHSCTGVVVVCIANCQIKSFHQPRMLLDRTSP